MEELKLIVDYGIIGVLGLMGFLTLYFFIERVMFYSSVDLAAFSTKDELELDLGNNVSAIATIGSNAPYIGLLGTVFGIMLTFYTLGESSSIDTKSIMTGLALALKATAMGLLVAIPSIVFYNVLVRKMEVLLTRWTIKYGS